MSTASLAGPSPLADPSCTGRDLFWPPPVDHAAFAQKILEGDGDHSYGGTRPVREPPFGPEGEFPRVRDFAEADPDVQRLVDPTWQAGTQGRSSKL